MSENAKSEPLDPADVDPPVCESDRPPLAADARTEKVDALVAEATVIKRLDYDRLRNLAEEAFELACELDDSGQQYRYGMAAALELLAHLSGVLGDSEAALLQASQALALLDSHDPNGLLGNLYLTMGWAHYQAGDYVDALNELLNASQIAGLIEDTTLSAFVMDRIANVYHATGHPSAALDLQLRALAIFRESVNPAGEALVLNNMTYTYLDLDDFPSALGSARGALEYAEAQERVYMRMGVLDTLAEVYRRMGDLDNAAKYSAEGLDLARQHQSEPDKGDALLTMGRISLARGHLDEARTAAISALRLAEKHRRAIEEFTCHELLSEIEEARGDIAAALVHFKRFHELERVRLNEESESRLANLQVEHRVNTARKDAEIHRLRSLALEREVEERRIAQAQLEAQASLDALTGLYNRRHVSVLGDDLERELAQGRSASLILFDIDRFKEINDTHGHFAGDRVLVSIARLLRDNARDSDTPCRYGGDEFLVLLSNTDAEQTRIIAERVRLAIATNPVQYRGVSIPSTISVGIATVHPGAPMPLLGLIERADHALYAAKHAGRNCVVVDDL